MHGKQSTTVHGDLPTVTSETAMLLLFNEAEKVPSCLCDRKTLLSFNVCDAQKTLMQQTLVRYKEVVSFSQFFWLWQAQLAHHYCILLYIIAYHHIAPHSEL